MMNFKFCFAEIRGEGAEVRGVFETIGTDYVAKIRKEGTEIPKDTSTSSA